MGTFREPSFRSRSRLVFSLQLLLKGNYMSVRGTTVRWKGVLRTANLEAERVLILSSKQSELCAASGRSFLHMRCREDSLNFIEQLRPLSACAGRSMYVSLSSLTLWTSSSVLFFSDRASCRFLEPANLVRASPCSFTFIAEIVASVERVRITLPVTKSRLVKCQALGLSN